MMMENNNKESFKLLSVVGSGSDSESEVPEFVLTPKKKRLKRRVRANHSITRTRDPQSTVLCGRKSISLVLAAVFLFCWLCTLSWLTVLLHGNIQQLDEMVGRAAGRRRRGPLTHVCNGYPNATLGEAEEASARAPAEPVFAAAKSRTAARMGDASWGMDGGGAPLRVPLRPTSAMGSAMGSGMGSLGVAPAGSAPGTKKMRKRRELDALAKRCPTSNGVHKRCNGHGAGGGLSSHDQLLSESSGDDSAALHGSGLKPGYTIGYTLGGHGYTPGLAVKRRRPARPYAQLQRLQRPCAQAVRACVGLLVLACVIATLTVMWLFIDVREQVFSLRTEIEQVVAGSQAVPDDLQKIHSLSRELQQNQTQLTLRVNTIAAQISNLSQQLGVVQTDLRAYTDHLQSNPEPSNIKDLMTNVALMGSQIKDLDNTVRSVKQQQTTLDTVMQTVGKNLTAVESSVAKLSNATLRPPPLEPNVLHELESLRQVVSQASTNISEANSTLTKRLQWLQDDQAKDHKVIEILQDLGQNVTARVKTLEGECAKIDVQNVLNSTITVLKEQVSQDAQRLQLLEHNMPGVPSPPVQAGQAGQAAYQVTPSSIAEGKPAESGSSTNEGAKRESLIPLLTESGITTPGG